MVIIEGVVRGRALEDALPSNFIGIEELSRGQDRTELSARPCFVFTEQVLGAVLHTLILGGSQRIGVGLGGAGASAGSIDLIRELCRRTSGLAVLVVGVRKVSMRA